jgi:hypothetical protein
MIDYLGTVAGLMIPRVLNQQTDEGSDILKKLLMRGFANSLAPNKSKGYVNPIGGIGTGAARQKREGRAATILLGGASDLLGLTTGATQPPAAGRPPGSGFSYPNSSAAARSFLANFYNRSG